MAETKKAFFTYKGVPLVRKGNTIYFGNMYDDYVVMIEILGTEKQGQIDVANKVRLRKMATDITLPPNEQIVKKQRSPAYTRRWIWRVRGLKFRNKNAVRFIIRIGLLFYDQVQYSIPRLAGIPLSNGCFTAFISLI